MSSTHLTPLRCITFQILLERRMHEPMIQPPVAGCDIGEPFARADATHREHRRRLRHANPLISVSLCTQPEETDVSSRANSRLRRLRRATPDRQMRMIGSAAMLYGAFHRQRFATIRQDMRAGTSTQQADASSHAIIVSRGRSGNCYVAAVSNLMTLPFNPAPLPGLGCLFTASTGGLHHRLSSTPILTTANPTLPLLYCPKVL